MAFKTIAVVIFLVIFSCAKPDPEVQKKKLAGYWEIKNVEMPSGTKKDFGINTIVDYIEIEGDSGIRTKVSPKLDGTFITNGVSENFYLKIEDDSLRMYYQTPFAEWKETVIKAADSLLVVKNSENKIYTYTKFQKFDFGE